MKTPSRHSTINSEHNRKAFVNMIANTRVVREIEAATDSFVIRTRTGIIENRIMIAHVKM